ncbi:hypothetical protein TRVA0_025S01794 [Trichomonascus vanleenenianus]|uniref:uncharacterized protein n=1 Tax=Trichomonascus vanleenenianus TaxID=2268995 RepID=UPI003ECAD109
MPVRRYLTLSSINAVVELRVFLEDGAVEQISEGRSQRRDTLSTTNLVARLSQSQITAVLNAVVEPLKTYCLKVIQEPEPVGTTIEENGWAVRVEPVDYPIRSILRRQLGIDNSTLEEVDELEEDRKIRLIASYKPTGVILRCNLFVLGRRQE